MGFAEQARISERHRAAQSRLQALVTTDTARVFPLLDVNNVDRTFGTFFEAMLAIITARRTISASLGSTYYSQIRNDYNLPDTFIPQLQSTPNPDAVFTSMLVTGPIAIKNSLAKGVDAQRARDSALVTVAKAAQRHVTDGGRATILGAVRSDRRSLGWARLTDGKPCAFCALLASRGPAYKSETTAKFRAHDGCGCTPVPVFDPNAPWPGRAEEFRKDYDETISGRFAGGDGNNEAVRAWRQRYAEAFDN